MKKLTTLCFLVSLLAVVVTAEANTIESSTMYFKGSLTDNGDGTYAGVLRMLDEAAEGIGDGVSGYDLYAKEGADAWFGDDPDKTGPLDPVWSSETIADHDAWPQIEWNPDTPDWYQYSLKLYVEDGQQKWAVRNHPAATSSNPWYTDPSSYPAKGVPMSGMMDWEIMYAAETDTGAYLPGTGIPEIVDGAAGHGGGPGAWDMDWSWGSEVIPLEFPGFEVELVDVGGGEFAVTLTPALPSQVWVDDDYDSSTLGWQITRFDIIQDAVDAVVDGDSIVVKPGAYSGAIVDKAVTISGEEGAVINCGPLPWTTRPFMAGFLFLADGGGDGSSISQLSFETVEFPIFSNSTDDVTVEQCKLASPIQGITNWEGSGWSINDNVINGLRTDCGGGIGIMIGCYNGGCANENFISDNQIMGEVISPEDECGFYSAAGINLMSDRRWDALGGTISNNMITSNKVSIFTRHVNISADGIGLDDLALYPDYADELPPVPDLTDNIVRANDLKGVKGQQISLNPGIVDEYNTIIKNNGAQSVPGQGRTAPMAPPEM